MAGCSAFAGGLIRMFGPVFVALAVLLIGSVAFIWYRVVLPFYVAENGLLAIAVFLLGSFLAVNIAYNYYMVVITPPGAPPAIDVSCRVPVASALMSLRRRMAMRWKSCDGSLCLAAGMASASIARSVCSQAVCSSQPLQVRCLSHLVPTIAPPVRGTSLGASYSWLRPYKGACCEWTTIAVCYRPLDREPVFCF